MQRRAPRAARVDLYRDSKARDTVALWQPLAAADNVDAQYFLASAYAEGGGVRRNTATALDLYRRSAESGQVRSQYNLGVMYLKGDGVSASSTEALRWLKHSALGGYPDAQYALGLLYGDGAQDVPQNLVLARKWLTAAAMQSHARAQFLLGRLYLTGSGMPRDRKAATQWFTRAAKNGEPDAGYQLAVLRDPANHAAPGDALGTTV